MAIREDLVASAAQFLQDPSVASSSVENRVAFLRSKNLTQEEIDVALARTGASPPPPPSQPSPVPYSQGPPQYYQQFPQQAWQPPPPPPRRDWRDWFIMATVVGGVSYGLYALGKRYVMPLVAPPTPEKLEQDKKSIEEQFDRAFSLVEQLAKDTETLKAAEQQRTERLDTTISELETIMSDLKSANRRREDDAQRIRDEVQALKDAIPKALNNQKDQTDNRLREINTELTSLKTLVSQRMNPAPTSTNPMRPTSSFGTSSTSAVPSASVAGAESTPASTPSTPVPTETIKQKPTPSFGRPLNGNASGKASIPAWQMALSNQKEESPSSAEETKENEASTAS